MDNVKSPIKAPRRDSNCEDHPVFGKLLPLAKLRDLEKLPTFLEIINTVRHVKSQYSGAEIKRPTVKKIIYRSVAEVI